MAQAESLDQGDMISQPPGAAIDILGFPSTLGPNDENDANVPAVAQIDLE